MLVTRHFLDGWGRVMQGVDSIARVLLLVDVGGVLRLLGVARSSMVVMEEQLFPDHDASIITFTLVVLAHVVTFSRVELVDSHCGAVVGDEVLLLPTEVAQSSRIVIIVILIAFALPEEAADEEDTDDEDGEDYADNYDHLP